MNTQLSSMQKVREDEMDIDELYNHYIRRAARLTGYLLLGYIVLTITIVWLLSNTHAYADTSKRYERIVSIGGSVTEIVYALGEQDRLIARDTTSVFPQEAFALPDVGYIRRLSPEGVLSVDPDLILALEGSGPPEAVQALEAANVPVIFVPEGYTAEKIEEKIKAVGAALNVPKKADDLISKTKSAIADVKETSSENGTPKSKILFVLSMRGGKVMAAGHSTAANGIIELAGAENVMSGLQGYKQVNDEAVITAQPDVILMMNRRGNHSNPDEEVLNHPAIATTPAGKNGKIIRMDGLLLLGFGPRTAQAISDLKSELAKIE